jgi:hypothetical protein
LKKLRKKSNSTVVHPVKNRDMRAKNRNNERIVAAN